MIIQTGLWAFLTLAPAAAREEGPSASWSNITISKQPESNLLGPTLGEDVLRKTERMLAKMARRLPKDQFGQIQVIPHFGKRPSPEASLFPLGPLQHADPGDGKPLSIHAFNNNPSRVTSAIRQRLYEANSIRGRRANIFDLESVVVRGPRLPVSRRTRVGSFLFSPFSRTDISYRSIKAPVTPRAKGPQQAPPRIRRR
jgi:hypothetical protein